MANKKERLILQKMIAYARDSEKYVRPLTFEEYQADEKTMVFAVFNLCQLGELVNRLDDDFRSCHTDIPWNQIKALRNRVVHNYEGIIHQTVWNIVQNDVPTLIENLSKLLEETE